MAKRENQTAGGRLESLRAQIEALQARKRELQAVTERPDGADPVAWVAKAGQAGAELAAIGQALGMLQDEARAAERLLAEAKREETARAAQAARDGIPAKLADVLRAADALGEALAELGRQESLVRALGGWVPATGGRILAQALGSWRGMMRQSWPQILGETPAPSREQSALAEAKAELQRARELLAQAERIDEGRRGELGSDKARLIEDRQEALAMAQQRVRDCETWAKEGKPARPAVAKPEEPPAMVIEPEPTRKPGRMVAGWEN